MSTGMTFEVESKSGEQTERLGQRLGQTLKGGEVIELIGDLGGGKTTFVRGLVRGTRSADKVASPTFTISKIYQAPNFTIYHFDFYRLAEPGVVAFELAEVIDNPGIVTVVEWGDIVQHVLPAERVTVVFEQTPAGSRQIRFRAPQSLGYLLGELQ